MSRSIRAALTVASLGTLALISIFMSGCSASAEMGGVDMSPEAPSGVLSGAYAPAAGVAGPTYTFPDATHYTLERLAPCDASPASANACSESGTYTLSSDRLTLSSDHGATTELPYQELATETPALTKTTTKDLVLLDTPLVGGGDGGAIVTGANGGLVQKSVGGMLIKDIPYGRQHTYVVQTKLYIAPIAQNAIGSLGSMIKDAALVSLAQATNLQFSEDPKDGMQESAVFRVWSQIQVSAVCIGTVPTVNVIETKADAGFEGPLKGISNGVVVKTGKAFTSTAGNFYELASGSPNPNANVAFDAIQARKVVNIWSEYKGTVTCAGDGSATVNVTAGDVQKSKFPSFRMWVYRRDGLQSRLVTPISVGQLEPVGSPVTIPQQDFVNLFSLDVPNFTTFVNGYESSATPISMSGST